MRIEPGIDALQFEKGADHESGADDKYVSERHFEADDDLARETAAGEAFAPAGAAQNDHYVWTGSAPRRRHAEDCGGHEARDYSEDQHSRINSDRIEAREMRRNDGQQFVNSEPGYAETA